MCVDWVLVTKDAVSIGDTVSSDAGGMPVYRVVAVEDGQAWLQDDVHAGMLQAPLERFPWKAAPAK